MQIVKLSIKNFLSISEAEIHPRQGITQIVGQNNQGKTTVLRAVQTALQGSTDGSLVKHGENMAEIILEFDNAMVVHRKIRSDGKQAVQVKREGMVAEKPQTTLDGLMAGISFNPLTLLDPKERVKVLMQALDIRLTEEHVKSEVGECPVPLPPVDYAQHGLSVAESLHRYFYSRRAEANKEAQKRLDFYNVKAAEAKPVNVAELPTMPDLTDKELEAKILDLRAAAKLELDKEQKRKAAEEDAREKATLEQRAFDRVRRAEEELKAAKAEVSMRSEAAQAARDEAQRMVVDTAKIQTLDGEVVKLQREVTARAYDARLKAEKETLFEYKRTADEAAEFAQKLDDVVKKLGPAFQSKLVSMAKLPIEGLEFRDGEFYLNGSTLNNLSSSAALRLAVKLARTVAKDTKVICIDGAELLDDDSFQVLQKETEGDGFAYFMTKVGAPFEAKSQVVNMKAGKATVEGGVHA